jgi:small membrane protein
MMLIQVIIIVAAVGILVFGLKGRQTHVGKAWKKIGLMLLVAAMVIAVIFPDTTNDLAHAVGVGRGADLLLYVLTLAFIAYVLNTYLQQQAEKDTMHRLARKLALLEANERYNIRKK